MPAGYWHPGMSSRLPGATVLELDGDHEALLTAPRRLADVLTGVASDDQHRAAAITERNPP